MSVPNVEVKGVILAAGKGVRMKSDRAKVLHEVLGRPVIDYVVSNLKAAGIEDLVVVVGHQAEAVKKAVSGVRFVEQKDQKGTGHALLSAESALSKHRGPVVVAAGDAPLIGPRTLTRLLDEHRLNRRSATFLSACLDDPSGYGRVVRDPGTKQFKRLAEDSDASPEEKNISEVNSGTYVFEAPSVFQVLKELKPDNRKGELYLTDALALLLAKGGAVDAVRSTNPDEIYGINSRKDLVAATNYLRWRILERHMDAGVTIVDPSTTFIEDGVEIGSDTVVQPFTVIRSGVVIGRGCEVGPFAQLRAGTVLHDGAEIGNFVEVKKSTVGPHSKAKHLTYLGDATLGERVNIGAGTITANYDGVNKNPTTIGDGVHTGSNTVLVAPVTLGKGARTGAGAVVVKGEVPAGAVVVGVPARELPRPKQVEKAAPAKRRKGGAGR